MYTYADRPQLSALGATNTIGNYASGSEPWSNAAALYPGANFTALQGRTFATWTFISTWVKMRAAYDIQNRAAYELAAVTLLAANMHFGLEWLWFGTMTRTTFLQSAGIDIPSLTWMTLAWMKGWYFN